MPKVSRGASALSYIIPLNIVDEFTRECLAIRIARRLRTMDVIELLAELFLVRGVPGYIRSDNGPEFVAKAVQGWLAAVGAQTAYITPGSPWEPEAGEELASSRPPGNDHPRRSHVLTRYR